MKETIYNILMNLDPQNNFCDHMFIALVFAAAFLGVIMIIAGIFEVVDRYVYPIKDKMIEFFSGDNECEDFEEEK